MKTTRLFLCLALSSLLLIACQKPEGDDVPVTSMKLNYSINDTTVLKLASSASGTTVLDKVVLKYLKLDASRGSYDTTSITMKNVSLPFVDTLWEWEPNTTYCYQFQMSDFVSDTTYAWDTLTTINPVPVSRADSAVLGVHDTLWLYGTSVSVWRAMMDASGIKPSLHFYWAPTLDELTGAAFEADIVKMVIDTLNNGNYRFSYVGAIPKSAYEGLDAIWYRSNTVCVWGNRGIYSGPKSISLID